MWGSWDIRLLKDCAKWYSGGTPRKSNPDYWGGDIPWISAKSLNDFFVTDSEDKVTELAIGNGTRLVPKNSILFVVRGMSLKTEFRMGITTRPVSFNQDVKALIAAEDIDPDYLAYAIKAKTEEILSLVEEAGHGTGVLPTSLIQSLEVSVPTLVEQKKIAGLFRAVDDKIELNRQMNATLEAMAQTLFKSWFVDFDPVIDNTLAAGNPIPEPLQARAETRKALGDKRKPFPTHRDVLVSREAGGRERPEAIQQQFPSRFVFSEEMGWVPEGWATAPLSEFGSIVCGKTPSKSNAENFGGEIPFIKIPDMHTEMFVVRTTDYLSETGAATQHKKSIPRGGVCVSCIATVGKVVITTQESHTNQQINSIVPNQDWMTPYLYFYMLTLNKLFHDLASGGSATLNMNTGVFSKIRIIKPYDSILEEFSNMTAGMTKKIETNLLEIETLTNLRDTLLPKLLSGQIRIPDAEAMVEQAAAG